MKLEKNMYVRTKDGNIFKIIGGNVDNWEIDIDYSKLEQTEEYWLELYRYNDNYSFFDNKNIIKSSFNIIDLIEVGDYVNGYKVSFKGDDYQPFVQCDYPVEEGSTNHYRFYEKAIYSIVTKESFESMSYKVC